MKSLVHSRRDGDFIELHEQVIALIDAESRGVAAQRMQILWIQMKIAPGGERQPAIDLCLQLFAEPLDPRIVERVLVAGMWGGDYMGNPISNGALGHPEGLFHIWRPVIETRQNVTVNVDHVVPSRDNERFMRRPRRIRAPNDWMAVARDLPAGDVQRLGISCRVLHDIATLTMGARADGAKAFFTRCAVTARVYYVRRSTQDVAMIDLDIGRYSDPPLLVLASLADGPKHGHAMIEDIARMSGTRLGPGTLYGAIARLEREKLIEPLPADERRQPYRLTRDGRRVLRAKLKTLDYFARAGLRKLEAR